MKIAVLFNCQGRGLTAALQALLPDASVDYFAAAQGAERAAIVAALAEYDHVISHPLRPGAGRLASRRLRETVRHFVSLPAIAFRAFHPDQIFVWRRGEALPGVTGNYHSRLAATGFLAGLSASQTAALYNRLVFARLGYLDMFEAEMTLLADEFAQCGVNAADMLARLRAGGCFMHSINHPKASALVELARLACGALGAAPRDIGGATVPDDLLSHPAHPVFDDIAAACGVAPEGAFRGPTPHGEAFRPINMADFVARSFALYETMDRTALRAADGVTAALEALGLAEWPAGRNRGNAAQSVALMTWHGTLLRQGQAGHLHLPLSVPDSEVPWLRGTWQDDAEPERLIVPGGVQVRPAWRAGMVCLAQGPHYVSADAAGPQTWCLREAPGDTESFLPATPAQLGVLSRLLAGEWAQAGAASGQAAHLAAGPAVAFGTGQIDLIEAWPEVLPSGQDGARRLAVLLDGTAAVLRQTVRPADPQPLTARSVAPGENLVLAGEDIFLPLPLTLTNAARRWLHEACGDAGGLPWRRDRPRAVIARVRDQRLVGPPPPSGMPVPRDGVLEGAVVLLEAAGGPAGGWMAPLLRLLAMAPFLASGTQAVALGDPADGENLAAAWEWAGLPAWPIVTPPLGLYTGRDVAWIDPGLPWQWPAETLTAARSILLRGAEAGPGRWFLQGPAAVGLAIDDAMMALGFEVLDLSAPAPEQLSRLRGAGMVIGIGEDLLATAFCPAGTKVVELCGDAEFHPAAWMLSCALGMSHAVLRCEGLAVDAARLGSLLEVLRYRS